MTGLKKITLVLFIILSMISVFYFNIDRLAENIIFQPGHQYKNIQKTFHYHIKTLDTLLKTKDDHLIHVITYQAKNPRGTILYFHGNRGNVQKWGLVASEYVKFGYNVVAWDYRGYGKSTGSPTFNNILEDGKMVFKYILKNEKNVILFGRSLGSGIACYLAKEPEISAIVLETPYHSMRDVIRYHAGPLSRWVSIDIPSYNFISDVTKPVWVIHGDRDAVIPIESAKELSKNVPISHLNFVTIKGGQHNNLAEYSLYNKTLEKVFYGK